MNELLKEDVARFAAGFDGTLLRHSVVMVTGATGLLGACMVRCLLALNRERSLDLRVVAVVRNREKAASLFGDTPGCSLEVHDFAGSQPFAPAVVPDYIVHFAGPTASRYFVEHPVETFNTVVDGTRSLLEYMRHHAVRSMVFASSLEVYGTVTDDRIPLDESAQGYLDPMDARSSYPMAKRAAECLCHAYATEYGVSVKTARLAQTFGAGVAADDNRVFAQFARSVLSGTDIVMYTRGELCRCYCYTTDAVEAMLRLLTAGTDGQAYNVANDDTYISVMDMARRLCATFNPTVKVVVQLKENQGYSPVTKLRLDSSRMRRLGWQPHYGLDEMFDRLLKSIQNDRL